MGLSSRRSEKYCENIELTTEVFSIDGSLQDLYYGSVPYSSRSYVEETGDTMDVWINLSPQGSVSFVVTPFIGECGDGDAVYRQCPGSHSCVRRQLFCDRVVNCPHAEQESEETDCKFPHLRGGFFNNFPLSFLILFLILTTGSILLIGWKAKRDNSDKRKIALQEELERLDNEFQLKVKTRTEDDQNMKTSSPPCNSFWPKRQMPKR